jgi:hypothetical protein
MQTNESKPITIVVANRPRIFRELLYHALATSSDQFEVQAVSADPEIAKAVRSLGAQWLIVTSDDNHSLPPPTQSLLNSLPGLSLIAMSQDGSRLEVLAAGPEGRQHRVYNNISLAHLVSVLSTMHHPITS